MKETVLQEVPYVWMNGETIPSDEANTHILTHGLHYGAGAFEGIRAYETAEGSAVFRLHEHMKRLDESARILQIPMDYDVEQLCQATIDILRANKLRDAYIRPVVFLGYGTMGLFPKNNPTVTAIAAWPWGAYLGEEGMRKGIRLKTSSFSRHHINTNLSKAKATGFYMNSIMAKREAVACGYDEALMLDSNGNVAECSGENIFILKDGKLITPHLGTSILNGITRATVIEIAERLHLQVVERAVTRDEVYTADEMFLTGTAAEITPVREVDERPIGAGVAGEIGLKIQEVYFNLVHGRQVYHESWLARYTTS